MQAEPESPECQDQKDTEDQWADQAHEASPVNLETRETLDRSAPQVHQDQLDQRGPPESVVGMDQPEHLVFLELTDRMVSVEPLEVLVHRELPVSQALPDLRVIPDNQDHVA